MSEKIEFYISVAKPNTWYKVKIDTETLEPEIEEENE